jgi:hypothetical protein
MGDVHFHVDAESRRRLEAAEETLAEKHEKEMMVPATRETLELVTPSECGELSDCAFRVYLKNDTEHRGQFHLVGHRAEDGALIYSNSVMIDQLG